MNKQIQLEKFTTAYNQLNAQQKNAVDCIEGPVMVIAGPGTGKTQILSARIGKILNETDALPENILCLTYTDAGVVAMRKRLFNFIGADAYKVNIYTFHAFCNDVIQDNLSLFEKTALDPISELETIDLFTKLIDQFPKNHPLKRYRGDVYFEINNLRSLFSTMKREGWTPEFILAKIDEYLEDIQFRDEFVYKKAYKQFKAGELKQNKIDEEKEKMEKLRAAVGEFYHFQEMMKAKNWYDFDDMINWVIKAFEQNEHLLINYQEKYQYILVDEYQDTSGTQNKIVELLINYWDVPNVFVVGDDDQSIYRFQGANIENMQVFAQKYQEHLLTVVLTNNYRSTQPILDISKTLINKNEERLVKQMPGLSKDLLAANTKFLNSSTQPIMHEYRTQREEMIDVTLQVEMLIQKGIQPSNIGIIYKENKYGEELALYLKLKNIPAYSKRSLNLFDIPFARKIISLIRYIVAEHDAPYGGDELLFEILHYNWLQIPSIEIAKLTVEVNSRAFRENNTSLRAIIQEKIREPKRDLFSKGLHENIIKAAQNLEALIEAAPNVTLQQLMDTIIQQAGILEYIMQQPDKIWLMQVLTALFDFIKEETRRNPTMTVEEFVRLVELMQKENIKLPLVQINGNDKGVNLLTAHGSKGLEFEYVFFVGCNASNWEKKRKPGGGYSLPDTMFTSQPKHKEEEELRRLFYVALTRAALQLTISFSKYKIDGKLLEPSMFMAEILEQHDIKVNTIELSDEQMFQFATLEYGKTIAPEINTLEEDFIGRILEKFAMNVTALNNYLACPLKFYFNNLIRIPSSRNEATEFGSAVHYSLEQLFKKMQNNNETFGSKESFIQDFNWYMHRNREIFTKEQYNRRIESGTEILSNYYDTYIHQWHKIVSVERNIRNVFINCIPLKGKLDKLEFNGKQINVVDYKTGDIEKAKSKLVAPNDKVPDGGDYWRQAVFYKILIDNYDSKDWEVTSTEFDFIEPDKKKNYQKIKLTISPADIATVKQQ
ncbi:MAG: UvrD-helicase domain-containing protein, partial [Chitinophagaceae bacterium]